jgi:hypothetical protein
MRECKSEIVRVTAKIRCYNAYSAEQNKHPIVCMHRYRCYLVSSRKLSVSEPDQILDEANFHHIPVRLL